jgi:hypothetical protein
MDWINCAHDKVWWQAFVCTIMNSPGTQKALNFLAIQMTFLHELSKEECGERNIDVGQNILVSRV